MLDEFGEHHFQPIIYPKVCYGLHLGMGCDILEGGVGVGVGVDGEEVWKDGRKEGGKVIRPIYTVFVIFVP